MKSYGVAIQMKATEQYFPVVLFIMLYKLVLTLNPVVWPFILKLLGKLSFGAVYYAVQDGSNFSS